MSMLPLKIKKIIMIIACLFLVIYPIIEAKDSTGYVSFRVYGFPVVLLLAILYVLLHKDIIPTKGTALGMEIYKTTDDGKLTEKLGVPSEEDKNSILQIFSGKCRCLCIDRNFKYTEKALVLHSENKTVTLFWGFDDQSNPTIKVNNIYFSVDELSDEQLKQFKEIIEKHN